MRLLNVKTFDFTKFSNEKPKYVIASHRWIEGSEATFKEIRKRRNVEGIEHEKVQGFARYIRDNFTSVEWLWIDTCCINQEDAAELSEAVNLMFEWYRDAEMCVAYLADVDATRNENSFKRTEWYKSEWFQRGWTLQELLAPKTVLFVTNRWEVIGNKGGATPTCSTNDIGTSLEGEISKVTGIPEHVLHDYDTSIRVSVEDKLKWMDGRRTTREEDLSYALYGIFGVTPGANYGERHKGARERLLGAIRHHEGLGAQQAERFRRISHWISPPDPWTNHHSARQQHEPETGTWLLQSAHYQSWKSGSTRHLWVHGKAGCGKTILCSTAIEDIRMYCQSAANAGHAIFYFSFADKQKQSCEDLVRSLVVQLGWKEPGLSILQQAYDTPNRSLLRLDELERILISSVESYDEIFVLLDALDECPEHGDARQKVLGCLERLSHRATKLRMLATSREVFDVSASMKFLGSVFISTETQAVDADIRRYMSTQLSHDRKLCLLNSETKALIEETISRNADGMFQWAYCQLQELKMLASMKPKYVTETLRSLPSTLDATYEGMLMAIKPIFRQEALILLRWLSYAESPPTLGELAEAAILDPTAHEVVDIANRGELLDTLRILSGLVIVENGNIDNNDEDREYAGSHLGMSEELDHNTAIQPCNQRNTKDTKVRLAHFSVKEFLESGRILQSKAAWFHLESAREHKFLSQSCLAYIVHYSKNNDGSSIDEDLPLFPLLKYVAKSWFYHSSLQRPRRPTGSVKQYSFLPPAQYSDTTSGSSLWHSGSLLPYGKLSVSSDKRRRLSCSGFTSSLNSFASASDYGSTSSLNGYASSRFENLETKEFGPGVYIASFIGLQVVVSELLGAGVDVNAVGGRYGNALQAASVRGHEKMIRTLIDAGADVDAQGGEYGTALQAASWEGHEKVVQMLVDAGADVHARGRGYGNALQVASWRGHKEVVRMLMDAGADINTQAEHLGKTLQYMPEMNSN